MTLGSYVFICSCGQYEQSTWIKQVLNWLRFLMMLYRCIYTGCFIQITKNVLSSLINTFLRLLALMIDLKSGLCVVVGLKTSALFFWSCMFLFGTWILDLLHLFLNHLTVVSYSVWVFFPCVKHHWRRPSRCLFISVPMWKYIFNILNE